MSVEKAREFLATLREKETDEALNKKAAAAKTQEEKITFLADIAHEMGYDVTGADIKEAMEQDDLVALDDAALDGVSGGTDYDDYDSSGEEYMTVYGECPYCDWGKYTYTGRKRPGHLLGLIDERQVKCNNCGGLYWR